MKVAIHQPEHFPYVGFFQKMESCDLFVILDDTQFSKNNFQNRNRFLNKNGVEEWFTVPVPPNANSQLINEVVVSSQDQKWKKKINSKLQQNFGLDLSNVYESSQKLSEINLNSIEWVRNRLGISTPMVLSSDLKVGGKKSEKLLNICREVGAHCYVSGQGGLDYLDREIFLQSKIELEIFKPNITDYYTTLAHLKTYENLRRLP